MKIIVADIPEEGLHLKGQFETDIFELSEEDDFSPTQGVRYDLKLRNLESLVMVEGTLYALFESKCSRCLAPFPVHVVIPEWEVDFVLEDEEEAGLINLGERIREDLLLELPSYLVCEEFLAERKCPGETSGHFESTDHTKNPETQQADTWAALDGLNPEKKD